ncbi:MAG: hypothetical protein KAV87_16530, partial [Desulfobacteraceae bacterium]|nr:hypothetical protein [Desulfobacteraceae bacterium]
MNMTVESELNILLVEDDEDDYIMTRDILDEIDGLQINLNWAYNADSALEMIKGREYDVYLLDYRLG